MPRSVLARRIEVLSHTLAGEGECPIRNRSRVEPGIMMPNTVLAARRNARCPKKLLASEGGKALRMTVQRGEDGAESGSPTQCGKSGKAS